MDIGEEDADRRGEELEAFLCAPPATVAAGSD
jgi:hypothetical protein